MGEENANKNGTEMEDFEVDTLEFSVDDEDIEELIEKLHALRETKSFTFEVDEENELQFNYEEAIGDEEGEGQPGVDD